MNHLIRGLLFATVVVSGALAAPLAQIAPPADDDVAKFVRAHMDWRLIPGVAIAVIQNGQLRRAQGFGVADAERNIPITPETVFHTGSIGKPFTAIAILKLVEQRRIQLDDPILKFFERVPSAWRPITVRHLLTHTSGLQNYVSVLPDVSGEYADDELIRLVASQPLAFKPGADFRYSNSGYLLLGFIVEKVSGAHLGDFLKREVFTPLGMTHTVMVGRHAPTSAPAALGYRLTDGAPRRISNVSRSLNSTGDGSLNSTVLDLAKWDAALNDDRLLRASTRQAMWSPVTLSNRTTRGYGLGWSLSTYRGHRIVEHGGTWQGFSGHVGRYVSDGVTVVVLTNLSNIGNTPSIIGHRIARYYIPGLRDAEWSSSVPVRVDAKLLDQYAGEYELAGSRFRIWREESTLMMSVTGRGRATMVPVSQTEFKLDVDPLRFRFARGPKGEMDLFVRQRDERRATRIR